MSAATFPFAQAEAWLRDRRHVAAHRACPATVPGAVSASADAGVTVPAADPVIPTTVG